MTHAGGEPRGFGFVTFAEHEQAKRAVASGFCTLGADQARCKVVFASPRPPRGGGRAARCFRPAGRPGLATALQAGHGAPPHGYGYGPLRARLRLPSTSTGLRTARPAPAAAAPAAGYRSCRRGLRRGHRQATAVADPPALPSVPPAGRPGASLSPLPAARWQGAARTRLTRSSKRRRRSSTAVLPPHYGGALSNQGYGGAPPQQYGGAPPQQLRCAPSRGANRSTALRPRDSTARLGRCSPARATIRRAAAANRSIHRHTTARPPTQLAPMARRRDPQGRRIEFARLLFRRSPRPIEIRYDETLRDERRPDKIETPRDTETRDC